MPIVATITTTDDIVLLLDKFLTPDGRVPDVAQMTEEELTAPGLDHIRYRDVGRRYRQFTVDTLETCSTYTAAVTRCRVWDRMKATNVKLAISNLGGGAYAYSRVHVEECIARAVPGAVAGSATPSNAAHVVASVTMRIMDQVSGVNP